MFHSNTKKENVNLIQEASQCQDNMVAFLNAIKCNSCQVRWFKIFAQRGKEMGDLLLAICIQKASSEPVPLVVGCQKMLQSPHRTKGQHMLPSPGPIPSPTAGASPPGLDSMLQLFF